jgi:hypothetical protein
MKIYGTPDADSTAITELMRLIEGKDVAHILHYPRVALQAKPCKWPGSLLVQAVLVDKSVVSVRQLRAGGPAKQVRNP